MSPHYCQALTQKGQYCRNLVGNKRKKYCCRHNKRKSRNTKLSAFQIAGQRLTDEVERQLVTIPHSLPVVAYWPEASMGRVRNQMEQHYHKPQSSSSTRRARGAPPTYKGILHWHPKTGTLYLTYRLPGQLVEQTPIEIQDAGQGHPIFVTPDDYTDDLRTILFRRGLRELPGPPEFSQIYDDDYEDDLVPPPLPVRTSSRSDYRPPLPTTPKPKFELRVRQPKLRLTQKQRQRSRKHSPLAYGPPENIIPPPVFRPLKSFKPSTVGRLRRPSSVISDADTDTYSRTSMSESLPYY